MREQSVGAHEHCLSVRYEACGRGCARKVLATSKASARQRAGRSWRTGPGMFLRLYTQQTVDGHREYTPPQVTAANSTSPTQSATLSHFLAQSIPHCSAGSNSLFLSLHLTAGVYPIFHLTYSLSLSLSRPTFSLPRANAHAYTLCFYHLLLCLIHSILSMFPDVSLHSTHDTYTLTYAHTRLVTPNRALTDRSVFPFLPLPPAIFLSILLHSPGVTYSVHLSLLIPPHTTHTKYTV